MTRRIGIVGAGMAGLACAQRLVEAGVPPVIWDKGRTAGGRLATRIRPGGLQFDHGAQYVTARSQAFAAVLAAAERAGAAAPWPIDGGRTPIVGSPSMNALAQALRDRLDIRQGAAVTDVTPTRDGWRVTAEAAEASTEYAVDTLVLTVPAPQSVALLGAATPITPTLSEVRMAPCLTLMAAFARDPGTPFQIRRDPDDPIAWIACDSGKPGRPEGSCWVAQANPSWSAAHIDLDRDSMVALMLPMLCDRLGADPATVRHAEAHRWRYARVTQALGQPFVRNDAGTLYVGGDWCLGARVEAAWASGTEIADDILAAR